jgi:hypothetical protein
VAFATATREPRTRGPSAYRGRMDESAVRSRAQAVADGLVAGDIEGALADLSPELRRNLGEVLTLLPLPASEATIESVEPTGSGWMALIRVAGASEEVVVATRWRDRDGKPTVIEVSHLSRTARAVEAGQEEEPAGPDQETA